jgi:hypothetical protein
VQLIAALRRLQEQSLSRVWQRTVQTVQQPRTAPRRLAEAVSQPTVPMRRSECAAAESGDARTTGGGTRVPCPVALSTPSGRGA